MKRLIYISLSIVWMAVIFLLSSEPSGTSSGRSQVIVDAIQSLHVGASEDLLTFLTRKAAHITAYFILGLLVYGAVRTFSVTARRAVLIAVACVLTYAVSDEIHQLFISGRSGEVRDVLIDTTAGTVSICLAYCIGHTRLSRQNLDNKL